MTKSQLIEEAKKELVEGVRDAKFHVHYESPESGQFIHYTNWNKVEDFLESQLSKMADTALEETKVEKKELPNPSESFEIEKEGEITIKSVRNFKRALENQDVMRHIDGFNEAIAEQESKRKEFMGEV